MKDGFKMAPFECPNCSCSILIDTVKTGDTHDIVKRTLVAFPDGGYGLSREELEQDYSRMRSQYDDLYRSIPKWIRRLFYVR